MIFANIFQQKSVPTQIILERDVAEASLKNLTSLKLERLVRIVDFEKIIFQASNIETPDKHPRAQLGLACFSVDLRSSV